MNNAAHVCSSFFNDGDLTHAGDYPDAVFDGACELEVPEVPCVCDFGIPQDEDICVPGDGNVEPTTGDVVDTDGPGLEFWHCSAVAESNCQTRTGSLLTASAPACWVPETDPMPSTPCVIAPTYVDALAACECLCDRQNALLIEGDNCDVPGDCEVTTPLDCTLTSTGEGPLLFDNSLTCTTFEDYNVACPANTTRFFDATVSVALDTTSASPVSTFVSGLVGYLDYETSNCVNSICDFDVSIFSITSRNVSGFYMIGTSVGGTYTVDDLNVQMVGHLTGTWYQSRGTIVFPTGLFAGASTMSALSLDSVSLPPTPLTLNTDQIVGSLANTSGAPLTLNLTFDVPDGTAAVSLTTR